jgi:hypothetical protein
VARLVTSAENVTFVMTSTMILDEQDDFIQQIMANHDAAMAATAELMNQTGMSKGTVMEREVNDSDFVRSSG